jgi:molybdopterin synthase sulfur carrier subunit
MTARDRARDATAAEATVSVVLPRALLDLFPAAEREVVVAARSVAEMIAAVDALWPGMRDRLCDSSPKIRRHINVFVEGQRAQLATELKAGSKVYVLTAISGG